MLSNSLAISPNIAQEFEYHFRWSDHPWDYSTVTKHINAIMSQSQRNPVEKSNKSNSQLISQYIFHPVTLSGSYSKYDGISAL